MVYQTEKIAIIQMMNFNQLFTLSTDGKFFDCAL